jgi:hypothetical protein
VGRASELVILAAFLFVPPLAELLGGRPPSMVGWLLAAAAVPAVLLADTTYKAVRARRRSLQGTIQGGAGQSVPPIKSPLPQSDPHRVLHECSVTE